MMIGQSIPKALFWTLMMWVGSTLLFAQPMDCRALAESDTAPLGSEAPVPSQPWLDSIAKSPEGAMVPAHGGLTPQGMPVWTHQVQRRQCADTSLAFNGWVKRPILNPHQTHWPLSEQPEKASPENWGPQTRMCYQRFDNGWLREQVTYHANGQVLHHLQRNALGQRVGIQRVWFKHGLPNWLESFDSNGQRHGRQLRWNPNGQLELDVNFQHGRALDEKGQPMPKSQQNRGFGSDGC